MEREYIPAAAQKVMPWANGGGSTVQVAIDPPDGSLASGFRWRVSRARVAADGPFSLLPGVDRALWLWRGKGMQLAIDGRDELLTRRLQRVDFAGEAMVDARLLAGPCEDINAMWRRDELRADVVLQTFAPGPAAEWQAGADALLLVLTGQVAVADRVLVAGDALRGQAAGVWPIAATAPSELLLASFHPRH
jgi:uncharacterized protein